MGAQNAETPKNFVQAERPRNLQSLVSLTVKEKCANRQAKL